MLKEKLLTNVKQICEYYELLLVGRWIILSFTEWVRGCWVDYRYISMSINVLSVFLTAFDAIHRAFVHETMETSKKIITLQQLLDKHSLSHTNTLTYTHSNTLKKIHFHIHTHSHSHTLTLSL